VLGTALQKSRFARERKRCCAPHSKTASHARINCSRCAAFGVRRDSAALVRGRGSGRDAQENPRRRCERMPGHDWLLALRSARQDADRTFTRDAVVCSRTKAVLRTALQNCERRTAFGVRRDSAALVRGRGSGRDAASHRTPKVSIFTVGTRSGRGRAATGCRRIRRPRRTSSRPATPMRGTQSSRGSGVRR